MAHKHIGLFSVRLTVGVSSACFQSQFWDSLRQACLCVGIPHVCRSPQSWKRVSDALGLELQVVISPLWRCWELASSPLQEHQASSEPSFQPLKAF